ncbi:MAG: HAD-IA family hydrolase [Lachnospiraceae bacterium]|nr:HAD-IA family hydrolase [Lachnospiraceae bacterium]
MSKKAVIFDLDGTLTNTLKSIWKSANLALADVGLPTFEVDRYRYFVGDGVDELVRRALMANGDEELVYFEQVRERYLYHFEKYVNYEVKPYDGICELLATLKERGILMAVNSNKPHERTVEVVEEIFGKGTFDMLVGQCEERARKPAPDGVLHIMDKLRLTPDEVVYLGDTCVDMQTGKSAGVYTLGALWGFRDRQELEENHADAIIEHPMEVLDYI